MKRQNLEKTKDLDSSIRKEKSRRSQRIAKDKVILQKNLAAYRNRGKPGSKVKMSDEHAIYCRQQCKERSLQSIADEIGFSRSVVERCVKGLTFKHLNEKEKPQW